MTRTLAWLALNHIPGAGAVTVRRLAARFGSPEATLQAPHDELAALGSLTPVQAHALRGLAEHPTRLERIAQELVQTGVSLLTLDDDAYPPSLRLLRDAPPLLYLRGTLLPADGRAVAIVGTRSPSPEGAAAAREIAAALAARGLAIVSGLALGVDAAAHRGAITSGRSIAVLGSGIDYVSPRQHRTLAEEVVRSGALLSEVPPGTRASRETLLARNRIQAGLARAVIVVQCRSQGGSFATARRALQAGRPVLAVEWEDAEFTTGAQRLQRLGAQALRASEVVDAAAQAVIRPLPAPEQMLLDDGI